MEGKRSIAGNMFGLPIGTALQSELQSKTRGLESTTETDEAETEWDSTQPSQRDSTVMDGDMSRDNRYCLTFCSLKASYTDKRLLLLFASFSFGTTVVSSWVIISA